MLYNQKIHKRYILYVGFIILAVIIGTNFLTAFPTIPSPSILADKSLNWNLNLANPYIMQGTGDDIVLNLTIKGKENTITERPPVNLVLILDRSGSMSENGKLEYAKNAANEIVRSLGSNDKLGIVAYSTNVEVLLPIQKLKNKDQVQSIINSIYPANSTNLSGGLIKGIEEIESVLNIEYLNRVILLSDGLANAGITSVHEINKIAAKASEIGITVSTMGLGVNYNENMLTSIAEFGSGNYYFIESPAQIASIFKNEFGKMVKTVAKNPKIRLDLSPNVQVKEVHGYNFSKKEGFIEINPGDLYGGQERNILIRLDVPTKDLGRADLVTASLKFEDVISKNLVTLTEKLSYTVTKNRNIVLKNENKEIRARASSVSAAAELYKAAYDYEIGNMSDAVTRVKESLSTIIKINKSSERSHSTIVQEEVLRQALDDMDNKAPAPSTEAGKSIIKKYKAESREQQK